MRSRRCGPWGYGSSLLALFLTSFVFQVFPCSAATCDENLVRARAEASVPGFDVSSVRVRQGIVTLLFDAREGPGAFAVALHAAGTTLSTSVMGAGLDVAELARAARPVATWWEDAELQRALAACSEGLPEGRAADLGGVLHAAAESMLPSSSRIAPMQWITLATMGFLLLTVGVLTSLWRVRTLLFAGDGWTPALLMVLALILRFLAHGGPSDIRVVIQETETRRAGWAALVHLIFAVLPRSDETIWNINRIAGALSVPLLYAIMRRRFADPIAAVGGAAVLAVTPLLVRFSASDAPYILLCGALLGAVLAFDHHIDAGSTGAMALGFGLLTAAMQLRPETPWLVVPAVVLVLSGHLPPPWGVLRRPSFVGCALLFLAINGVLSMWAVEGNQSHFADFMLTGALAGSPWSHPEMTPWLLAALVVLGAASAATYWYRAAGLLWLLAVVVAFPLHYPVAILPALTLDGGVAIAQVPQYANARYHIPAMYLACGLAGLGVAILLDLARRLIRRDVPAAGALAIVLVCVAAAPRFDLLARMWTPQREFELFRDGLARVDPACRVVAMLGDVDAGFVPFGYLVPGRLVDAEKFLAEARSEGCAVFYRGGNCYALEFASASDRAAFEINAPCRSMAERFRLEPIVEAQVPAQPYRGEVYARDPLPLGFYRVRERTGGDVPVADPG